MTTQIIQTELAEKPTTPIVMAALRERYCAPEFAFFEEVGDAGSSSRVYADGVAINMWASRGYSITGFEVKVSRSDWLRELKQPEKSEPVLTKCDYWFLVAPDDVFVPDEVPPSWGILSFKDGKLREKRKAPKLEPKAITRAFVAQMFRRAHEKEERDISGRVQRALADDRAAMERRIEERVKQQTRQLREEAAKWEKVCSAVGEQWIHDETLIAAIKVVMKSGVVGTYSGLESLLRSARGITKSLEQYADIFAVQRD